ncbi:hypothetical protein ACU6U9_23165 [Pseudomonas sp. HK3]
MEGLNGNMRISVPDIQQSSLSFCDGSVSGFEAWSKKLPMANVGAAAKLLYQASRELNLTQINPIMRYKMLEIIRSQIYSICELLGKRFLNQSVVLNDNDLKIVMLAQTLQNQLAIGYKHIILNIADAPVKKNDTPKLLTFAIHRAISDLSQTILRAFQLYNQSPKNAWLELHQLYILAESKQIQLYDVKDSQGVFRASTTIFDSYVRILLLGCSKPNQLRQSEQANLYAATELWSNLTKLASNTDSQAQFVFMATGDSAPVYRSLVKTTLSGSVRTFNPGALVQALQKHLNKEANIITVPGNISESLLSHLLHAWGGMKERSFRRTQNSGDIQIGIGLVSSHFFCAREKSFPYLLKKWNVELAENKPKNKRGGDVWDNSFDAGNSFSHDAENIAFDSIAFISKNTSENDDEDTGPKGKELTAQIENTSPGGYGIFLSDPPATVQTGELVIIREPRINNWSVGSIRWIRSRQNMPAQLGIELLAPKAEPVAVRILNKTGENGEYLRGIRLPALPAAGQEETLLLPILPFKVGSKAELVDGNMQQRIQLIKRQSTSRSFVQYHYQSLTQVLTEPPKKSKDSNTDDEFASIWDKL